jgi:hypothetical protein
MVCKIDCNTRDTSCEQELMNGLQLGSGTASIADAKLTATRQMVADWQKDRFSGQTQLQTSEKVQTTR